MIDAIPNEMLLGLYKQCDELSQIYKELKQLRQKKEDNKEVLTFFKENKFANEKHLLVNVGSHFIKSNKAEAFSLTERTQSQVMKDIKEKEIKQASLIKNLKTVDPTLELLTEDAYFIVTEALIEQGEDWEDDD